MLRSDNGETWKEHTLEANEEAIQDVLNHSFEGEGEQLQLSFCDFNITNIMILEISKIFSPTSYINLAYYYLHSLIFFVMYSEYCE